MSKMIKIFHTRNEVSLMKKRVLLASIALISLGIFL